MIQNYSGQHRRFIFLHVCVKVFVLENVNAARQNNLINRIGITGGSVRKELLSMRLCL